MKDQNKAYFCMLLANLAEACDKAQKRLGISVPDSGDDEEMSKIKAADWDGAYDKLIENVRVALEEARVFIAKN